jgi:hypothetical protein
VFHVQFRQFPNVARTFNLTREELDARILRPWAAGQSVKWSDRRWSPDKAKLTIYEGPALRPEEIGLGRGWQNATRSGEDVTERVLAESDQPSAKDEALALLKQQLLDRCRDAKVVPIRETVVAAGELQPDWRASDRLALAEQAIWELLHLGSVRLLRLIDGHAAVVEREEWQPLLLEWTTWAGVSQPDLMLECQRDALSQNDEFDRPIAG